MKRLLLGSAVLTIFAIAITLFQISCKKDAIAQATNYNLTPATTTKLGGIIVGTGLVIDNAGILSTREDNLTDVILYQKSVSTGYGTEWWTCFKDGSNQRKVNFPSTITVRQLGVSLLSDKKSVVFSGSVTAIPLGISDIYTMNIDGTNLQKIVTNGSNDFHSPQAYW
jgi:hypothetical protein